MKYTVSECISNVFLSWKINNVDTDSAVVQILTAHSTHTPIKSIMERFSMQTLVFIVMLGEVYTHFTKQNNSSVDRCF